MIRRNPPAGSLEDQPTENLDGRFMRTRSNQHVNRKDRSKKSESDHTEDEPNDQEDRENREDQAATPESV